MSNEEESQGATAGTPKAKTPTWAELDKVDKSHAEHLEALNLFKGMCIDTNIYDNFRGHFENQLLRALKQFEDHRVITLLMPEMIQGEVRRHVVRDADAAIAAIKKALKAAEPTLGLESGTHKQVIASICMDKSAEELAVARFDEFLTETGTETLAPSDYVDIDELQELYLSGRPPFENAGDKKSEFPDAFALLTLEKWAVENDGYVVVVSEDSGWRNFCAKSKRLHILRNLADAIGLFPHAETANAFLSRFGDWLLNSGDWERVKENIEESLWTLFPNVEAHAHYSYHDELTDFTLDELVVDMNDATIVSANNDEWVIQLPVQCTVTFEGSFTFTVRDGIDRDDVPMGQCMAHATREVYYSVVLTFAPREHGDAFPELLEYEATAERTTVDFGYVGPD